MATGDTLAVWTAADNRPPSTANATPDRRNGHFVYDFDAATDEEAIFEGVLARNYDGGGVTVALIWMGATATTGTCRWQTAFERHQDDTTDLDTDSFAAFQSAGTATANVSGEPQYTDVTHTNGAQMDSLAVGESFRLKVRRDADGTSGTDDMAGDAELLRVELRET